MRNKSWSGVLVAALLVVLVGGIHESWSEDLDYIDEVELVLDDAPEINVPLTTRGARSSAFRCSGATTLGGFGDTFRRSDTRACSGARSANGIVPRGGFVPGVQGRTFVASITPCVGGTAALFTTSGQLVASGNRRPGCPNGRATVDFCAPGGGGAVQLAQRFGEALILQWNTARGSECFRVFPRYTTRNGRCVPNRPGVGERGEPPLRGGVCR